MEGHSTSLLFDQDPVMDLTKIKGDMTNTQSDFSFTQHSDNGLIHAYLDLSTKACTIRCNGLLHNGRWGLAGHLRVSEKGQGARRNDPRRVAHHMRAGHARSRDLRFRVWEWPLYGTGMSGTGSWSNLPSTTMSSSLQTVNLLQPALCLSGWDTPCAGVSSISVDSCRC